MAGEWTAAELGREADLLTGFPFTSEDYTSGANGVRLLRGDNIAQGRLRWDGAKYWPREKLNGVSSYQLSKGDVILAMDRPWIEAGLKYGAVTSEDVPCLLVQRVARLRGGPSLDTRFLRYLIGSQAFTDHILAVQTGTAVPHISGAQIKAFRFRRPPLLQQQAIACVLGALDDKIELNRRRNRTLEAMARAIFQSWFVDFDPVRAKAAGRAPDGLATEVAALFPAAFEDSPLGPIPKGWRWRPLPDICDVNPTRTLSKGTLAPYLDMANMPTQGPSAEAWVMREMGSGMKFRNGDTLVARITPCLENGKSAFVDFLADGQVGWGSTEYIVLRPKAMIPPVFAYLLARTENFRTFAIQQMTGSSGRQRVPADSLGKYSLASPELDAPLFVRFGQFVAPLFARMTSAVEQSRTLAALRDALLPKLISGKLRVVDAERIVGRAT